MIERIGVFKSPTRSLMPDRFTGPLLKRPLLFLLLVFVLVMGACSKKIEQPARPPVVPVPAKENKLPIHPPKDLGIGAYQKLLKDLGLKDSQMDGIDLKDPTETGGINLSGADNDGNGKVDPQELITWAILTLDSSGR